MNLDAEFFHSIYLPFKELAKTCSRSHALDQKFNIVKAQFCSLCTSLYHFPSKAGLAETAIRKLDENYAIIGDISNSEKHTKRDTPDLQVAVQVNHVFEYDAIKGYKFLYLTLGYNYPRQNSKDGIAAYVDAACFVGKQLNISHPNFDFQIEADEEWHEFPILYTNELSKHAYQFRILTVKRNVSGKPEPIDAQFSRLLIKNPDDSIFCYLNMPNLFPDLRTEHLNSTIKFESNKVKLYDDQGNFIKTLID